jgi:hypothetical protein
LGGTSRQPSWVSVVVLIGELLGPAPTSPERPYEKAWTAFDFATLRLPRPTVSVVGRSFLLWGLLGLEVG